MTVQVNNTLRDLNARERMSLWPIAVMALVMGVIPTMFLRQIDPAVRLALVPFANSMHNAAASAPHILQVLAQVIGR